MTPLPSGCAARRADGRFHDAAGSSANLHHAGGSFSTPKVQREKRRKTATAVSEVRDVVHRLLRGLWMGRTSANGRLVGRPACGRLLGRAANVSGKQTPWRSSGLARHASREWRHRSGRVSPATRPNRRRWPTLEAQRLPRRRLPDARGLPARSAVRGEGSASREHREAPVVARAVERGSCPDRGGFAQLSSLPQQLLHTGCQC